MLLVAAENSEWDSSVPPYELVLVLEKFSSDWNLLSRWFFKLSVTNESKPK